ncbi:hypothetical protein TH63_12025 [Rufibacter radiotolerans]|uniref:TonB-linked SusC/RagA family outer membrane protein n=1 Tax=Rufibacter radiotolerans TaxID=1379910 RepID=A0A0H4VK66_9BACT|nr:TonB-dependent receptor [Rufibacter radiotolerans]AKQ46185.1 hypothetical protein TH63_12025 [Rufibacter radiotolerans]
MKKLDNKRISRFPFPEVPKGSGSMKLMLAVLFLGALEMPASASAAVTGTTSEAGTKKHLVLPKHSGSNRAAAITRKGTRRADITVKGKVTSVTGEPLIGVTVLQKGTTRVAVTDVEGNFTMVVPENAVLEVSYVGFEKQEVNVAGRTQINIELQGSVALEEVVVVGYGTIEKSDFTGSSSTVKIENANDNRVISVPEAIQGRVAGVQIMNNTGQPGSGMTFNIRGMTSVTGSSQPLIVVDGQPIDSDQGNTIPGGGMDGGNDIPPADPLASLNTDDIESIEILKDASSVAIYGSRGANGVVLITTKSGKEGRDRISFSSRFDVSMLPKKLKVLNTRDYLNYRNEASLNDGKDSVYTHMEVDSILRKSPNIDWQDEVYSSPINHTQQLSFSGKDEKSSYLLSANYTDQESILTNADFKRYGLRLNYTREVTKKLTVGIRTYFSIADRNYGQESNWTGILGSSAVLGALSFNPLRTPYVINDEGASELDENFTNSPTLVTTKVKDKTKIRTLISNLTLDYKLSKSLKYSLKGGVNDLSSFRQIYNPTGTFIGDTAPGGSASQAENTGFNYLVEHLLSYNKTFVRTHRINAVAGYTYQKWENRSSSNTSMTFPSDALTYYNMQSATNPGRMITGASMRALQSVLGRVNYSYDKRYLFTLTGRYDGATRLSGANKWAFFPSVGLGWNVSNEDFFKNKYVNFLKLRASIGVAGNENISIGATQAKYGLNYVVLGPNIVPSYTMADFENPNLKWETTTQMNVGAEVGFFNDRLTLDVDVYKKNTRDLLINLTLPGSAGYSDYFTNLGEVMNQGVDIEGNLKVIQAGQHRLDVGGNFSIFENKVLDLGPTDILYGRGYFAGGAVLLSQAVHVARPGDPISSFWGYKTAGVYQSQEEINADPALANDNTRPTYKPGDVKWVDFNGDGQINSSDKTIIGNPSADFTYGFNANYSYKRFTLGINVFGSYGNELINLTRWVVGINNTTGNYNLLQSAYDGRWRGEGTSNQMPRVTTNGVRLYQRVPDWLVEDASFVRLQSVNIGYVFNMPKNPIVRSVRAFVSGTNLYTWTKYSGYDPNINAFGHLALNRGVDLGTMGQPRTFSTGFEVNF